MHTSADDLVAVLRSEGLRVTKARRSICRVLAESHSEHLSAGDILERVSKEDHAVDPSTVYRTLETLQTLGHLEHVHFGHGPGVYHLADEAPHHHLVCDACGKSVDIPLDEVRPVLQAVTERHGFVSDSLHFALSGRCRECAEAD